jgi:hypothetical protein
VDSRNLKDKKKIIMKQGQRSTIDTRQKIWQDNETYGWPLENLEITPLAGTENTEGDTYRNKLL